MDCMVIRKRALLGFQSCCGDSPCDCCCCLVAAKLHLGLLQPHWLWPTRLLCLWDFPDKNTGAGVSCHFLPQEIFPTQGSNPCLLLWRADSFPLSYQDSLLHVIALSNNSHLLSRECMFLDFLSLHNKDLEWRTLKPLGVSQLSGLG